MMKPPTTACELCGAQTRSLATKLCDPCWELKNRIEADPELTLKILLRLIRRLATYPTE